MRPTLYRLLFFSLLLLILYSGCAVPTRLAPTVAEIIVPSPTFTPPEPTVTRTATQVPSLAPSPPPSPTSQPLARLLIGKLYTFVETGPLGIKGFTLDFGGDAAALRAFFLVGSQSLPIGLDGAFRSTTLRSFGIAPRTLSLKGAWTATDTFTLSGSLDGESMEFRMRFQGDQATIDTRDALGARVLHARLSNTYPTLAPENLQAGQHAYSSRARGKVDAGAPGVPLNYLLYLPKEYDRGGKAWPLILFLHGVGERDIDPAILKKHPLPKRVEEQTDFPFIVVSPQLTLETERWADRAEAVNSLLDELEAILPIDPGREYLSGLSMGGFGTWALALRYPTRFAALAPVAGGLDISTTTAVPDNLCALKNTPIWIFHGGADRDIPPAYDQTTIKALAACGASPRVTIYPDTNHEASFTRAYAEPELYTWLAAQSK